MTADSISTDSDTLSKTRRYADAHSPREHPDAIIHPDISFKVAYNIYRDTRYERQVRNPEENLNLVFSHGAQMCKELWEYIIEMFFDDPSIGPKLDKVIAIDAVTHGDSYVMNECGFNFENTWADCGRDITHVIRDAKLTGTTILVGHSMGGTQSMYAAFFEPGLIDSVVVIDPMGYNGDFDSSEAAKALSLKYTRLAATQSRDTFEDYNDYYTYTTEVGLSKNFHPRCQKDFIEASVLQQPDGKLLMKTPHWQQLAIYVSGQLAYRDCLKTVASLDCEILHVFPAKGYVKGCKAFRAAIRYGTFVDIPDSTHLVPFEKPRETFQAIKEFISKRYQRGVDINKEILSRRSFTLEQRQEFVLSRLDFQLKELEQGRRIMHSRL